MSNINTTLKNLAILDLQGLSKWVAKTTNGTHFIPRFSSAGADLRDSCFWQLQETLMDAIRGKSSRKDSHSLQLAMAEAEGNMHKIATVLSSEARTYYSNKGFFQTGDNVMLKRGLGFQIKNEERAEAKQELAILQLDLIGAIVEPKRTKSNLKNGIQNSWDFEETALIIKKMENEGEMLAGLATPEFDSNYHKAIAC